MFLEGVLCIATSESCMLILKGMKIGAYVQCQV